METINKIKTLISQNPKLAGPDGYNLGTVAVKDQILNVIEKVPAWIKKSTPELDHVIFINKKGDYSGLFEIIPVSEGRVKYFNF